MTIKSPKIILADEDLTCLKLTEIYLRGFLRTCELVPCPSEKKVLDALRTCSPAYPDYLITNLYVSDLHGLELIRKVKEYFLQQYNCRPPFPIILLLDCCTFDKAFLEPDLLEEHPCIHKSMVLADLHDAFTGLPIDGCIFKPPEKERLDDVFSRKWPDIQNANAYIRMQMHQRFVFKKKGKESFVRKT
jgi:hypothetical protein